MKNKALFVGMTKEEIKRFLANYPWYKKYTIRTKPKKGEKYARIFYRNPIDKKDVVGYAERSGDIYPVPDKDILVTMMKKIRGNNG